MSLRRTAVISALSVMQAADAMRKPYGGHVVQSGERVGQEGPQHVPGVFGQRQRERAEMRQRTKKARRRR